MKKIVVDANAIKAFQEERVNTSETSVQDCMDCALKHGAIALDDGQLIEAEWLQCASYSQCDTSLADWISLMISDNKIVMEKLKKDRNVENQLKAFGMDPKDRKYVHLGCTVSAHAIVTDDIDFHDPKKKKAKNKAALKASKKGPVCKYLKKTHLILVLNWEEIKQNLQA